MLPSRAVMSQAEPLINIGRTIGMGVVGCLNFNQGYLPLLVVLWPRVFKETLN